MFQSKSLADDFLYGLSFLDSYIKLCNKTRLSDINIISEQFACEMLNALYDYDLINANEQNGSTVGYDLISTSRKIVVQVSSEIRPTKAVESIRAIHNILKERKESLEKIVELSDQISQSKFHLQEYHDKFLQFEEAIEQYSKQNTIHPRTPDQLTALNRDRSTMEARIESENIFIDECSREIDKRKIFLAKSADLHGYRVIILFLTTDVSNIRKSTRVAEFSGCEGLVFNPETDILDFATLTNHVTKSCLFTKAGVRVRQFMEQNSALFIHKTLPKDRVCEVIDEYAGNFESKLFLHKYENSNVTLHGMYVPPAFSEIPIADQVPYCRESDLLAQNKKSRNMVQLLCNFLWQKPKNDRDRILFIEGHAAIGKTSLISWLCYHYQKLKSGGVDKDTAAGKAIFLNRPIVCVRLRELEFSNLKKSTQAVLDYLNIKTIRDFERNYSNAIIILDGADELSMVSSTSVNFIEEFIDNIRSSFSSHKLIITTRPDFINMANLSRSTFRIRRIILEHYDHEMRLEWIKKYQECGEEISPNTEAYILGISDSTAIGVADTPLALYLLTRCDMREELQGNQWSLFHEIFANAIARAEYNENFDSYTGSAISLQDSSVYYQIVANIAFRMFQNSREERYYLKEREIDEVIRNSDLKTLSREHVKKTCVLCAYWKNTAVLGALEFYHNNIRDFFFCEYICERLRELFCTNAGHANSDDFSENFTKLMCELFCWADVTASTWQQAFTFIYLRLKYEAIHKNRRDSLYALLNQIKYLPTFIYRLSVSKNLWNHKSNEIPYISAKHVFVNSMLLMRILYEFSTEKAEGKHIQMWTTEGEYLNWNKMNLLGDWKEMLQRKVNISAKESIGIVSNTEFGPVSFSGLDMLNGIDFKKCSFIGTLFENSKLCKANFSHANLKGVFFHNADLYGADFSKADIHGGAWTHCLNHTNFSGACINKIHVGDEELDSLCFSGATVKESLFMKCRFKFLQINQNAEFHSVDFSEATISGEVEHSSLLSCNFHLALFSTNTTLDDVLFAKSEMNTVRFEGKLNGVLFKECEMRNCDFSKVTLFRNVVFENCNLTNANFQKADLNRVHFVNCILDNTDFFQAQMVECVIKGDKTTLNKANFGCAYGMSCEFSNVDFSRAKLHNSKGFDYCASH